MNDSEKSTESLRNLTCPVIAIRGRSGSGKTTLINRIVGFLTKKGFQIAVVKHSGKARPAIDPKGKDTARHLEAGASIVVGSFKEATVFFLGISMALNDILRAIGTLGKWDLILIEGYYAKPIPNIALESGDTNELTLANSAEEPFDTILVKLQEIIQNSLS